MMLLGAIDVVPVKVSHPDPFLALPRHPVGVGCLRRPAGVPFPAPPVGTQEDANSDEMGESTGLIQWRRGEAGNCEVNLPPILEDQAAYK